MPSFLGGCSAADAELAHSHLEQFDVAGVVGAEEGLADYLAALADHVRWTARPDGGWWGGRGGDLGPGAVAAGRLRQAAECDALLFEAARGMAREGAEAAERRVPRPGMLRHDPQGRWRERWPRWGVEHLVRFRARRRALRATARLLGPPPGASPEPRGLAEARGKQRLL